jgi:GTP-binding protein Era
VGKSSLLNTVVNAEVAITSSKPETTRKAIRGVYTDTDNACRSETSSDTTLAAHKTNRGQIVFVDTPGIHRPRTLLGKRLNAMVDEQLTMVDVILWLTPADEPIGKGDHHILQHLVEVASNRIPLLCVVTKIDKVKKTQLMKHLFEASEAAKFREIIPMSAKTGENLGRFLDVLFDYLPPGPLLYDKSQLTDESWQDMCSEIVRGAALESLNDELPHSLTVSFVERVDDTIYINLYVERDSQKGIILGAQGANIAQIRRRATRLIREMLNERVTLNLQVKVAKNWQTNTKLLNRLGY